MFHRGDEVVYVGRVMDDDEMASEAIGTVLYSCAIWNAPTMRSDSYNHAEDWRHARYVVRWDSGLVTYVEPQSDLSLLFKRN